MSVYSGKPLASAAAYAQSGFSVLEQMLAVGIVGILTAVAMPNFQEQTQKTRRSACQADLVELASHMQRFYTENNRFDQDVGGTAVALPFTQCPKASADKYYTISLTNLNAASYTLSAAPISSSAQSADACGTLTLAHTGARGHASGSDCW